MKTSPKSNDQQEPEQAGHSDALSGWGAIIGAVAGFVVGLFFHKALVLGTGLGVTGWLVGAVVDRTRR